MNYFTTNTYKMKRDILNFSKKISEGLFLFTRNLLCKSKKSLQKVIYKYNYS